jgi:hypothetical protein
VICFLAAVSLLIQSRGFTAIAALQHNNWTLRYNLGCCFRDGKIVIANPFQSAECIKLTADQNGSNA